jgi:4-hydroxybenzoate polyprenyltransferase
VKEKGRWKNKMTNILRLAFEVSRVRFWLYLGGTYLIGYIIAISAISELIDPFFIVHLFFFMLPANIILYGINDISDKDTDMFNPKKGDKEYKALESDATKLYILVGGSLILCLILVAMQPNLMAAILFLSWLGLSVAYSAEPIRFKARPVVDFASNFLYVIPAILAFYQVRLDFPPLLPLFAAFLWTSAMQLFSAIPDIEADKKANIKTTAVVIGEKASLLLCLIFWTGFAGILILVTQWNSPWNLMMLIYPAIPLYILLRPTANIARIYWYYPYYTAIFGIVLFFSVGLPLLL